MTQEKIVRISELLSDHLECSRPVTDKGFQAEFKLVEHTKFGDKILPLNLENKLPAIITRFLTPFLMD